MPTTSKKQHKFMEAVANNPSFAKKVGVPQSVGQDFSNADKGKTFKRGGDMASKMNPGFMAMMAKKKGTKMADGAAKKMAGGGAAKKMAGGGAMIPPNGIMDSGGGAARYAKGGSASSRADGVATKGKTKGTFVAMKKGGKAC